MLLKKDELITSFTFGEGKRDSLWNISIEKRKCATKIKFKDFKSLVSLKAFYQKRVTGTKKTEGLNWSIRIYVCKEWEEFQIIIMLSWEINEIDKK